MTLKNVGRLVITLRSSAASIHTQRNYSSHQSSGPGSISVLGTEVAKAYNPVHLETKICERWKSRDKDKINLTGLSKDPETDNQIFRMILPPPNVTGKLHLGHALTVAIQDTIARLKFMSGSKVEWIPGFDHAGIATQSLVLKKLQRNFETKILSLENLEKELPKYANSNRKAISKQLETLGALLDWEKEYYTLDHNHSEVVKEAFIHLFDSGIIRRGDGIVNWSCPLESSISDIEVEEVAFNGKTSFKIPGYDNPIDFGLLYFCEYPVSNYKNVVVATSRPETMFGDTAIAVHPDDLNYKELIGQIATSPLNGKSLQIIADTRIKMNFGTGAVKITPGHDKFDFAIGMAHGLPTISTFSADGSLNDKCGEFKGMGRYLARSNIIEKLKKVGALVDTKEYTGTIGICSRTQDVIEPFVIPHWYFKTKHLTTRLLDAIFKGEFIVKPDYQQNNFVQLLNSTHDWCLSRQIKWGHQIPVYRHKDFPNSWVAASKIEGAQKLLEDKLKMKIKEPGVEICQDTDVLDTWFSSALIPLSVSGWPNSDEFHQISLMETGFDIVLFWVWRMAIMNLALTERLPFHNVLLHGVVTDSYGRKMSKSKGNVIDPMDVVNGRSQEQLISDTKHALKDGDLDVIEYDLRISAIKRDHPNGLMACGADALRFSLLGHDISLQTIKADMSYMENCKHFCNKLWQAMRFYLLHAEQSTNHPVEIAKPNKSSIKSFGDQWILACLYEFTKNYEESFKGCRFHLTTEFIRNFLYAQYCDVYLELVKNDLRVNLRTEYHILVMRYVFCTALKLSHPFLPFVTEEIWYQMTGGQKGLILDTCLPTSIELEEFRNDKAVNVMKKGIPLVKEIRSLRTKYLPSIKEKREFLIELPEDETEIISITDSIEILSKTKIKFDIYTSSKIKSDMLGTSFLIEGIGPCRISILKGDIVRMPNAIDEIKLTKMQDKLNKLKKQFDNPTFQQFAPIEAKERLKRRLDTLQMKIDEVNPTQSSEH